jgi:hypothetical protein
MKRYVKLRSWHIQDTRYERPRTLCGRGSATAADTRPDLPMTERSCESCFRIFTRRMEGPESPDEMAAVQEDPYQASLPIGGM